MRKMPGDSLPSSPERKVFKSAALLLSHGPRDKKVR